LHSFVNDDFKSSTESTNGASFLSKSLQYSDKMISFQVSFEKFNTYWKKRYGILQVKNDFIHWHQCFINVQFFIFPVNYNGNKASHAAIIVYDITEKSSFDSLKKWVEELMKNGPENLGMKQ